MRPRIHLNCATSLDGRLAAPDGAPLQFSDDEDLVRVHQLRGACDAILVGVGTVLSDDPSLRVKSQLAPGADPLRVVLDTHARCPPDARILDGSAKTLLLHGDGAKPPAGCDAAAVATGPDGRLDLEAVLTTLWDHGAHSVLVEGGGHVLESFLTHGLWDHFTLYQAPVLVGGDGPSLWQGPPSPQGIGLRVDDAARHGHGVLWSFTP